jgi:hypothetical protein
MKNGVNMSHGLRISFGSVIGLIKSTESGAIENLLNNGYIVKSMLSYGA